MDFSLKQQVIEDAQGRIKYKVFHQNGRRHYHIEVWLDGLVEELDKVEHVEYLLHPTFKNPLRSSANRDNKFSVTFWTWGMFAIQATVHYKNGGTEKIKHYLSYELPPDFGTNYVMI